MTQLWQTTVTVPQGAVGTFELMLGDDALAVSSMELPRNNASVAPDWIVEIITDHAPDADQMARLATLAANVAHIPVPEVDIDPLQSQDWVQMSLGKLAPVHADRFYVYGHHDRGTTPASALGLQVDAGQAFGTGQHGTTKGCLEALCHVNRKRRTRPRRVLDIGTGTGVLAIGAAKLWHCPVVATDIDPLSVVATKDHCSRNYIKDIRVFEAGGTHHPLVKQSAPYDVIVANILANPLIALAGDVSRASAHGADVVLSGLTDRQANRVKAAYTARGFKFVRLWDMGRGEMGHNWVVLLFQKT